MPVLLNLRFFARRDDFSPAYYSRLESSRLRTDSRCMFRRRVGHALACPAAEQSSPGAAFAARLRWHAPPGLATGGHSKNDLGKRRSAPLVRRAMPRCATTLRTKSSQPPGGFEAALA